MFCKSTLTKVAVSRQRHEVGVQEMLVADFIWAVVIHAHLQQSVVLLLHSYDAYREQNSRWIRRNCLEFKLNLSLYRPKKKNTGQQLLLSGTFPVVSSRSSKHQVMVVLRESGRQTLLARAEHLVAPGSAFTEVPVPSIFIRGLIDGQVLTQDITAAGDVLGLLRGVGEQALLIAMSTSLKQPNKTNFEKQTRTEECWRERARDSPQSFPQAPDSEQSPPSTDSPCSQPLCSL